MAAAGFLWKFFHLVCVHLELGLVFEFIYFDVYLALFSCGARWWFGSGCCVIVVLVTVYVAICCILCRAEDTSCLAAVSFFLFPPTPGNA